MPISQTLCCGTLWWCRCYGLSTVASSGVSHHSAPLPHPIFIVYCLSVNTLIFCRPDTFAADQGENNAGNPRRYNCSFPAMINDWRAKWADYTDGATRKDFPFGWGQLNSCGKPDAYKNPLFDAKHTNCGICAPQCNVSCLGELHGWSSCGVQHERAPYRQPRC
jgi:hypothetical protein